MTADHAPIPRRPFALATGTATFVGMALAWALATNAGGLDTVGMAALLACIAACGALCIFAMLGPPLVTGERFGLVVFGTSAVRTFMVMAAMLGLVEAAGLAKEPVVHGLLAGVVPIMLAEALTACWLIHRRDQTLAALRTTRTA